MGYTQFRYARRIDADTIGLYHEDLEQLLTLNKTGINTIVLSGTAVAGHAFIIQGGGAGGGLYPSINFGGTGALTQSYLAGQKVTFRKNAVPVVTLFDGGDALGGVLGLMETTTPAAVANWGALYTKNDDELYFQTGAGVEKTVTTV